MPTYEYECLNCFKKFEFFQSITDKPKKKCPECAGKLKKIIGAGGGILFKGSGFYATDYRSAEYKKKAKQEKETNSAKKTQKQSQDKKQS